MSNYAIRVEGLGKQYTIGAYQGRYKSLRDSLMRSFTEPLRRIGKKNGANDPERTIWALKDVSFDIEHGEVVGIIGRNGAGKSTLLKLLARITEPTEGLIRMRGRVGSLLEVGTGFHPELTGRENIFLNGAILGMSRVEIQRKFDEIVDFAEIEKFIDTPAKHYSSGMYMRLAFAVAAHLEPEILLVDEVLAVGDAQFQRKCLGKMGDVAKEGRTVLFVSHNMAAVQNLCARGMVFSAGENLFQGEISSAINYYLQDTKNFLNQKSLNDRKDRVGDQSLHFTSVEICDADGNPIDVVLSGQDIFVRLHYVSEIERETDNIQVAFNVFHSTGMLLTNLNSRDVGKASLSVNKEGYFECYWPSVNLRSGTYVCNVYCDINGTIADWVRSAFTLKVEDGDFHKTGTIIDRSAGEIFVHYDWRSIAFDREQSQTPSMPNST